MDIRIWTHGITAKKRECLERKGKAKKKKKKKRKSKLRGFVTIRAKLGFLDDRRRTTHGMMMMSKRRRTTYNLSTCRLSLGLGLGLDFHISYNVFFYTFMLEMDTINVSWFNWDSLCNLCSLENTLVLHPIWASHVCRTPHELRSTVVVRHDSSHWMVQGHYAKWIKIKVK